MTAELIQRFFLWWFAELALCIPRALASRLKFHSKRLLVSFEGDQGVVHTGDTTESICIARFQNGEVTPTDAGSEKQLKQLLGMNAPIELLAPENLILSVQTSLPMAAQNDVSQALRYQIHRISPFHADDVHTVSRVVAKDRDAKMIAVEVFLVPKGRLTALESSLPAVLRKSRRASWFVRDGDHLIALPTGGHERGNKTQLWVNAACGSLIAALCASLLAAPYLSKTEVLEQLNARVMALQPQAKEATELRRRGEKVFTVASHVTAEKSRRTSQLTMLKILTEGLGDEVWLTDYRSDDKGVIIAGFAPDASALLTKIKSLNGLADVSFTSAIVRDQTLNLDRFSMTLKLATS